VVRGVHRSRNRQRMEGIILEMCLIGKQYCGTDARVITLEKDIRNGLLNNLWKTLPKKIIGTSPTYANTKPFTRGRRRGGVKIGGKKKLFLKFRCAKGQVYEHKQLSG